MTLLELYDPIFQCVCRLNRTVRAGGQPDITELRAELKSILNKTKTTAAADPVLASQHEKLELSLTFFVDFMVRSLNTPAAQHWQDLASEKGELAGDEKFFDLLDQTLEDRSDAAAQRLLVYYTCMGLGFSGWYTGQPEQLRKKMLACSSRLGGAIDADDSSRICPDAYEHVNSANLIEPPANSLVGIGIALIGLIVMLLVGNVYFYHDTSKSLNSTFDNVIKTSGANGVNPTVPSNSPGAAAQ